MEKEKLSDLTIQLCGAQIEFHNAEKECDEARGKYLDGGGYSWGYYGSPYFDKVSEARSKVEEIANKIDNWNK